MLLMFVYVPLFPYISDGPFWPQKGLEQGQCNKTWWYNMLYINNFFNEVSFNVDILSEKNAQFFLFYSYFICLHILSWHHDLQTVMYKLARFNTRLFALYCILHWLTIVICMNGFITVYLSSYINVHVYMKWQSVCIKTFQIKYLFSIQECMAWTWYLANDMQFFILSPFIIIPLY